MEKCKQKEILRNLFFSYLSAALPEKCLDRISPIKCKGKTLLVGVGKASTNYCKILQGKINSHFSGLIISNCNEYITSDMKKFNFFYASHPIPDNNGILASEYLMNEVTRLTSNDLLLFLVSGGGSALLPAPPQGFDLEDERILNQSLLSCGAPIQVMNLIRKHFSRIKGGRLAKLAYPAKVRTLVVSDIPDDDIAQVASGPTLPTLGTPEDALIAIKKHNIEIPQKIKNFYQSGEVDTPHPDDSYFRKNEKELLASAPKCMKFAVNKAQSMGLKVVVISDRSQGESKDVAMNHVEIIKDYLTKNLINSFEKVLFLSGGETSVKIANSKGKGGRNGEYLLSLAIELESVNLGSYVAIAADTDGIDGTEKNAGAIIDQYTLTKIRKKNLSPKKLLKENNSYLAFQAANDLFFTGKTGTNVNDFRAVMFNIN